MIPRANKHMGIELIEPEGANNDDKPEINKELKLIAPGKRVNVKILSKQKPELLFANKHKGIELIDMKEINNTDRPEIDKALELIALGKQENAKILFEQKPELLLMRGTVTDYPGRRDKETNKYINRRKFTDIYPLQYTLWALDENMRKMLIHIFISQGWQYDAKKQFIDFEKSGVMINEIPHFLIFDFYKTTIAYEEFRAATIAESNRETKYEIFMRSVRDVQREWPIHIIEEMIFPGRPFNIEPSFDEPLTNRSDPTSLKFIIYSQDAFSGLGIDYALSRNDSKAPNLEEMKCYDSGIELERLNKLWEIRKSNQEIFRDQLYRENLSPQPEIKLNTTCPRRFELFMNSNRIDASSQLHLFDEHLINLTSFDKDLHKKSKGENIITIQQRKAEFVRRIEDVIEILAKSTPDEFRYYESLFAIALGSHILNIHKNPKLDRTLRINNTSSKKNALGLIRHAALNKFIEKMSHKLSEIERVSSTDKLQQLQNLADTEIAITMNSQLFSLKRSNWAILKPTSFKKIKNSIYKEAKNKIGLFSKAINKAADDRRQETSKHNDNSTSRYCNDFQNEMSSLGF